jgi:Zn-dependent protease
VFLQQPTSTPYDIHFRFGGIPVRIHPIFWLSVLLLGARGTLLDLTVFAVVVFISILVHELGHALAIRYYGWEPSIVLYAFGGLATYHPGSWSRSSSRSRAGSTPAGQIVIALAGPAAGLALAGCVALGLLLGNRSFLMDLGFFSPGAIFEVGRGRPIDPGENLIIFLFVAYMMHVNLFWSLVNLLPVIPLDGGRVAENLLVATQGPDGTRHAYILSMVTGAVVALLAVTRNEIWIALLFGMLAYQSYQATQHRGFGPW